MISVESLYEEDIQLNDQLFFSLEGLPLLAPLINERIVILAGFTGSGKSTLLKELRKRLTTYTVLPDRRELTGVCIIDPMLKREESSSSVLKRSDRITLVKKYKKVVPEGMAFVLEQLYIDGIVSAGYLFDGIRGEEEIKSVLERFKAVRIIQLEASSETRSTRLLSRKDEHDELNEKMEIAKGVVRNDLDLHGREINRVDERLLTINTDHKNANEVLEEAFAWIIN